MDTIITAVIFAVIVILSITQKIKEQSKLKRAQRQEPPQAPPGASRQAVPAAPQQTRTPPARELLEALLGIETEDVEEEGEWIAEAPARRPELPRQVERPAATPPPIRSKVVVRRMPPRAPRRGDATELRREQELRKAQHEEQQRRSEAKQRRLEEQARQHRGAPEPVRRARPRRVASTAPTPRRGRKRLFGGMHEVRKAIVFAEILGSPRAFEDLQKN